MQRCGWILGLITAGAAACMPPTQDSGFASEISGKAASAGQRAPLGATVHGSSVSFRVWAPNAS